MSNEFFNWSFDVAPGSTNRSRPVENEFAAIGTAFDKVASYFTRTTLVPVGETIGTLPAKEDRKSKSAAWDADGNWTAVVAATSVEMAAAIEAATTASTAADTSTAAAGSVSSASSYIQQLMLAQGVR